MEYEWWRPLLAILYLLIGYSFGWEYGYYRTRMGWDGFWLVVVLFVFMFVVAQCSASFP